MEYDSDEQLYEAIDEKTQGDTPDNESTGPGKDAGEAGATKDPAEPAGVPVDLDERTRNAITAIQAAE